MAKKKRKQPANRSGNSSASSYNSRPQRTRWGILLLLGLAIAAFIYSSIPKSPERGPKFTHEGNLSIQRGTQNLADFKIEIADNREDITQGLMYRKSMEQDHGMLFLMDTTKIQRFWMLNTLIPLDIIFIDEQQKIVNIAANTQPGDLNGVQSTAPARYVLEINAGYASQLGLRSGDALSWVQF